MDLNKREENSPNSKDDSKNPLLYHVCEVCGKAEWLTSDQGYEQGWDYPPKMGKYGVVSPRTCGCCAMSDTVWWQFAIEKKCLDDLSEHQKEVIQRIVSEPQSIMPDVCSN